MTIRKTILKYLAAALVFTLSAAPSHAAQNNKETEPFQHKAEIGDSWIALAIRYGVSVEALHEENQHPNPLRNPVIGDTVIVPVEAEGQAPSRLERSFAGGLLAMSARANISPWLLARTNGMAHPFRPLHGRAIAVPVGNAPPKDLPIGFKSIELSAVPAQPGWPLAFRGTTDSPLSNVVARLGSVRFDSFVRPNSVIGVTGTGAFFSPGAPELAIVTDAGLLWAQPWRVAPGVWDFDQVTLTGEAAAIDQAAIAAERERMFQIWTQVTPEPQWGSTFQLPINDFLGISSSYGARRSYNGGPYSTYHEGVDFSAYRGTPVFASGDGTVALAENLYVRGGAVVIDHGLGIYSGYYHMSAVHAQTGQKVIAGDLIGEVGTEGLSSGNHLHWDFLVAGTWVDAQAWHDQNLACWILEGWGAPCQADEP